MGRSGGVSTAKAGEVDVKQGGERRFRGQEMETGRDREIAPAAMAAVVSDHGSTMGQSRGGRVKRNAKTDPEERRAGGHGAQPVVGRYRESSERSGFGVEQWVGFDGKMDGGGIRRGEDRRGQEDSAGRRAESV